MIPDHMVKTRLDRRVNRAYQIARERHARHYVYCGPDRTAEGDPIYISSRRPEPGQTDGWVLVVDPAGFAMALAAGAEEP